MLQQYGRSGTAGLTCYRTLVAGTYAMHTPEARLRALPFRSVRHLHQAACVAFLHTTHVLATSENRKAFACPCTDGETVLCMMMDTKQ